MSDSERYVTGTGTMPDSGEPRYLLRDTHTGSDVVFRRSHDRDQYLQQVLNGVGAWASSSFRIIGRDVTLYENVQWDYDSPKFKPVNDYKQKYEDLARALALEADRRNWCPEFEKFAEDNGIPEELRKPATVKLRVTLEVEVDANRFAPSNPKAAAKRVLNDFAIRANAVNAGKVEML